MRKINFKGQSMMELVVGIGMVAIVVTAIALVTSSSLRNTQFSKNQVQATELARQNLEKVRAIKNSNYGVCLQSQPQPGTQCSSWQDLWAIDFVSGCTDCTFEIIAVCTVSTPTGGVDKPLCLSYNASRVISGNLSSQIRIEDEGNGDLEKRITSLVYWTDATGEHSSQLVTVLSRR